MKEYIRRLKDLNIELSSLDYRIKKFEKLNIDIDNNDLLKGLMGMAVSILAHAESEIDDIYLILYNAYMDQKRENK